MSKVSLPPRTKLKWNVSGRAQWRGYCCWRTAFVLLLTLGLWQLARHIVSLHFSFLTCLLRHLKFVYSEADEDRHFTLFICLQYPAYSGCSINVLIGYISDYMHLAHEIHDLKNEVVWVLTNPVEDEAKKIVGIIQKFCIIHSKITLFIISNFKDQMWILTALGSKCNQLSAFRYSCMSIFF